MSEKGRGDSRWYGLMPLILDSEDYAKEWLIKVECGGLDSTISENEIHTVFHKNIEALADCFYDYSDEKMITLGKMPDDLVSVLTNIAIAAPAVCVNRVYKKYEKSNIKYDNYLPSLIAKLFLDRMNTVESTAVIELACGKKTDDKHWQNVLTYCKQGNLQAVFDEYAHMLVSGIDDE